MELPDSAAKMVRDYIEVHGDPFAPYYSTNLSTQTATWTCNGCRAVGHSKWPGWKLEMTHEAGCAWVVFRGAMGFPQWVPPR